MVRKYAPVEKVVEAITRVPYHPLFFRENWYVQQYCYEVQQTTHCFFYDNGIKLWGNEYNMKTDTLSMVIQ